MALINYWKVIRRRWLVVLIPTLVVLIFAVVTYRPPTISYNVGITYLVGQPPSEATLTEDEERLYNWQASEYIVNGLADWVNGNRFKTAVSQELAAKSIEVPPGSIGMVADNVRSTMLISITYPDADILANIIEATTTVLNEQHVAALPQIETETAVIIVPVDDPIINPISAGIRSQLDIPLRLVAAVLSGLGLAFIIDYLDPTIRERQEIQALGLNILGEIPKN